MMCTKSQRDSNPPLTIHYTYRVDHALVFQIPFEDRCLDPQILSEKKTFRGSFHNDPHKVFGGFWKARDYTGCLIGILIILYYDTYIIG